MTDFTANVESRGTLTGLSGSLRIWSRVWRKGLRRRLDWGASAICVRVVVLLVLTSSQWAYSSDVVLMRAAGEPSSEQHELELATQFYGLTLKVITANGAVDDDLLHPIQQRETVAVAIEANALNAVNQAKVLRAVHRPGGSVPVLILGLTTETDQSRLAAWSSLAAGSIAHLGSTGNLQYVVGKVEGITGQLTGLEFPSLGTDTFYFAQTPDNHTREILSVRNGDQVVPVFIEEEVEQQKVFLLCKKTPLHRQLENSDTEAAFAEMAAVMIFTKYCAGDKAWHALQHYANLTIDDPWLREPYGHLAYKNLLKEMERHNFHTTIAFIPWNYDRSEGPVVALFRDHPERFSVCIHGDNHDHKEFDDFGSKPLSLQIAALKQSLARMHEFQALTGISYDNVFVFPHNIGSESILEQLKRYNFIATVNSVNVPMDRTRPSSLLFALRPATLYFGDFPSISRAPATMTNAAAFIGINEFLDNPLFFYGHQDFFASGIDAFDGVADQINQRQPDTRWRGLGDIVKNLYVVRLRDDSNFDVLAFSSNIVLNNSSGRDAVFHIQKQESASPLITSASVDNQPVPFELKDGYLALSVAIPAGEARSVVIRYKDDLDLASISISKSSFRVSLLRKVSDVRDITLSKSFVGRAVITYYYKDKSSPLILLVGAFALIVAGTFGTWRLLVIVKKKILVVPTSDVASTHQTTNATRDTCARL